eukprot:4994141-Prorocentrum_lima.AAC.1
MSDVRDDLKDQGHKMERGRLPGIMQNELFYADDTACFSTKRDLLEATLRTIEKISASYGLRLNKT